MIKWKRQKKRVAKGGEKSDSLEYNIVMVILAKLCYNVNNKCCIFMYFFANFDIIYIIFEKFYNKTQIRRIYGKI
jgi:hypothetical protein